MHCTKADTQEKHISRVCIDISQFYNLIKRRILQSIRCFVVDFCITFYFLSVAFISLTIKVRTWWSSYVGHQVKDPVLSQK